MTITCNLKGGLGNQLFQIFTTISVAKNSQNMFVFFDHEYLGINSTTKRQTYWNTFLSQLIPHLVKDKEINIDIKQNKYRLLEHREESFSYKSIPDFKLYKNDLVFLNGYFQSPKYFESYKNEIINLLSINQYKKQIFDEFDKEYDFSSIISIHFRLGDYKKLHNYHPILPIKYYIDSITYIVNYLTNLNYLIDTNTDNKLIKYITILYVYEENEIDNEIVEKMLQKIKIELPKNILNKLIFKKIPNYLSDWKQMLFMSCCSNNIIANSTFSWWSAFLNDNPHKMVCYPSIWFGKDNNHNINDLFLPEWKKINCV